MSLSRFAIVFGFLMLAIVVGKYSIGLIPRGGACMAVTPSEFEIGTITVGQSSHRSCSIRNTGSARLLITDIKTTCQCTIADLPSREVLPGHTATLHITVNPRVAGPLSQRVVIQTNDQATPASVIMLTAHVVAATRP